MSLDAIYDYLDAVKYLNSIEEVNKHRRPTERAALTSMFRKHNEEENLDGYLGTPARGNNKVLRGLQHLLAASAK